MTGEPLRSDNSKLSTQNSKLLAFLRLIRFKNLLFIAATQCLFYFAICIPVAGVYYSNLFWLTVASSFFIAAAGYIINDYFDVQIDAINKPARVVIDTHIKRRWAIVLHWTFSAIGLAASVLLSYLLKNLWILVINFGCVTVLWLYSVSFKKRLLIGNVCIAALTAWTILYVYFFAGGGLFPGNGAVASQKLLLRLALFYSAFAFITTLIREAVKDLEDMEGDRKYGCRTMPIKWGVPVTKVYTAVWLSVCTAGISAAAVYAFATGNILIALYALILIAIPLLYMLQQLFSAAASAHYARLSLIIKLIMLAGILSMIFFLFK